MQKSLLTGLLFGTTFMTALGISIGIERADGRRDQSATTLAQPFGPMCRSLAEGAPTGRGLFLAAARAYAAETPAQAAGPPPLLEGVASTSLAVTANAAARRYFDQGMGLVDGFNHFEAVRAFRAAQELDPSCALCFWGEALALGPNINDTMDPTHNARAVEAARLALEKADGVSEVERALIEALQTRYAENPPDDRTPLDAAFADAMQEVADRFPNSDQVQAIAAEAIMDAQPWDYWEAGGRTPKGNAAVALERIERVLQRNPDHVLAIHLYIHLTEASDDPWRAAPYADRLAALAPGAGHIVHMPAHTYFRVGRFGDSLRANVAAVAADKAYLATAGDAASEIYRYGYYPHNIHFLLTSAQMAGDGATVMESAADLDEALPNDMAAVEGWVQLIKAAPFFAKVQFGDDAELEAILSAAAPEGAPAYIEAAWRYARGEAAARLGRAEEARAEVAALETLDRDTDWETAIPGMPGKMLVDVMRETVLARAAMAEDDLDKAIDHWATATEMQAALPYLEPPFWYYPARQSFAAALLMAGQAERAKQEFFRILVESPDNGWAYWGLAKALEAQGDEAGADAARTLWRNAWLGSAEPTLNRL